MANKYAITGGGNWSGATWATTSGQAVSNTTAPTTADVAYLDASSGNVTVDTTTCTALSMIATGYTGTLTISANQKLTIRAVFTLGAGMTLAGTPTTSQLNLGYSSTACTWNFADLSLPWSVTKISTGAVTLNSNVVIQGVYGITGTHNFTGVAYTMEVQGGWGINTSYYFNDSATNPTVKITGGTILGYFPNSQTGCILEPSVSDITLTPHTTTYQVTLRETTYLKAVASTYDIITTGSAIYVIAFTGKIETGTACQFNVLHFTSSTVNLQADLYCYYYYINNGTITINTTNGSQVYVSGYMNYRSDAGMAGNAVVNFSGSQLFYNENYSVDSYGDGTGGRSGVLTVSCPLIINVSGAFTFYRGNSSYTCSIVFGGGGSITYTSGTVTFDRDINPSITGEFTLSINDWNLGIMAFTGNTDILNVTGDLTLDVLNMYAGSAIAIANTKELTVNDNVNA